MFLFAYYDFFTSIERTSDYESNDIKIKQIIYFIIIKTFDINKQKNQVFAFIGTCSLLL